MIHIFIGGIMVLFALLTAVQPAAAADDCTIIYGGGEVKCEATQSADQKVTATSTEPAPTNAATTKGGLPVYSPTPTTQTPDTGPEAFALITLVPAAALGLYLRNKTK